MGSPAVWANCWVTARECRLWAPLASIWSRASIPGKRSPTASSPFIRRKPTEMPRLAICMVSFNCLNVIKDCLDSLEKSEFRDFEVVVADNGSVDGTLEYLRPRTDITLIEN